MANVELETVLKRSDWGLGYIGHMPEEELEMGYSVSKCRSVCFPQTADKHKTPDSISNKQTIY